MRPFRRLQKIAVWMLRLTVASIVYIQFFQTFIDFQFKELSFLLATVYVVSTFLLLIGGFLSNSRLTVICGLIILLTSVLKMFLPEISIFSIMSHLPLAALGIFFLAYGNKS